MATYIGYLRFAPSFAEQNRARRLAGDAAPDRKFRQMVTDLPDKLPAGSRIIGAYTPLGGAAVANEPGLPGVMIVESGDSAHLTFITEYYTGYLIFQWAPCTSVGANRQEREAWAATATPPVRS